MIIPGHDLTTHILKKNFIPFPLGIYISFILKTLTKNKSQTNEKPLPYLCSRVGQLLFSVLQILHSSDFWNFRKKSSSGSHVFLLFFVRITETVRNRHYRQPSKYILRVYIIFVARSYHVSPTDRIGQVHIVDTHVYITLIHMVTIWFRCIVAAVA